MDKTQFWQIIDDARKTAAGYKSICEPLTEILATLETADIIRWSQIFDEYRNLAYKNKIWAAAALMYEGCPKNLFEAFMGWLIAQGKEVYLKTLENPDSLADLETVRIFGCKNNGSETAPEEEGDTESACCEAILYASYAAYGNGDFYMKISENPLSEREKSDIAAEVRYAEDIDVNWWDGGDWTAISENLHKLFPNLYSEFNKTKKSIHKKQKHKRA